MPIVVHHLTLSRSHRLLWLLHEMEVEYELVKYERGKDFRAPKSMRDIHPLGKSPMIELEDGTVLAESGAMFEELLDLFPSSLRPEPGTDQHRRYRFYMHYPEGSMMTPTFTKLLTTRLRDPPIPFFLKPISRQIAKTIDAEYTDAELDLHRDFLEGELAERAFVAGNDFTAADIMISYPLDAMMTQWPPDKSYPNLTAYLSGLKARDAYRKAVEVGGPPLPPS